MIKINGNQMLFLCVTCLFKANCDMHSLTRIYSNFQFLSACAMFFLYFNESTLKYKIYNVPALKTLAG